MKLHTVVFKRCFSPGEAVLAIVIVMFIKYSNPALQVHK